MTLRDSVLKSAMPIAWLHFTFSPHYHAQKENMAAKSSELISYTAEGKVQLLKPGIFKCVIVAHISQVLEVVGIRKASQESLPTDRN